MIVLVVIWTIAAACGFAAAAAWEPFMAVAVASADMVDPTVSGFVREMAAAGAGAGTAIGWLVAVGIGLPLTLIWLLARLALGLVREPASSPREPARRRGAAPTGMRPQHSPDGGTPVRAGGAPAGARVLGGGGPATRRPRPGQATAPPPDPSWTSGRTTAGDPVPAREPEEARSVEPPSTPEPSSVPPASRPSSDPPLRWGRQ